MTPNARVPLTEDAVSEDARDCETVDGLVARAAEGDEDAFRRLAERFHPRIYRWALARTGDPDEADDVAQEVLVRIYRSLGEFAGRARFATWVYRITANVAGGQQRKHRRRRKLEQLTVLERSETEPHRELESLHLANLAARALDFFQDLPEQQRVIFDLVDLQGMTPAEVADLSGMNRSTVRAHLFKARRTIRRRMLEAHPEMVES